jgi:citrate/tricarballylate utilization protein
MANDQLVDEAIRIVTICNACRYCEGHCAVFPAITRAAAFDADTMDHLANLCHQCGACYQHCQYADPHEFNVNIPKTLADVRQASYEAHLWPSQLKWAVHYNGWFTMATLIALITAFIAGIVGQHGIDALFKSNEAGFYGLIPHQIMINTFGLLSLFVVLSWVLTFRNFWRTLSLPTVSKVPWLAYRAALADALNLKNLGGGHDLGCYDSDEKPSRNRRQFHHLTVIGFLLCFAATSLGTVYHYLLQLPAPYDWLTLPKLTGTIGGVMLFIGSAGLLYINKTMTKDIQPEQPSLGTSLIWLLLLTSMTGLLLPVLRETSFLAALLAIHLGCVAALFLNFALGKFVHGFYRLIALIADHADRLNARS